jgi:hypothetical protein
MADTPPSLRHFREHGAQQAGMTPAEEELLSMTGIRYSPSKFERAVIAIRQPA